MELLADRGMIVDADPTTAGHAAGLTARGRIALRKANRRTPMTEVKMNPDEIQRLVLQVIQDGLTSPNGLRPGFGDRREDGLDGPGRPRSP